MHLAALEFRKLRKGLAAVVILTAQNREGYEDLIGMQTRIVAVEILDLCLLDRLNHTLRDEPGLVVNAGEMLGRVYEQCSARTQQRAGLGSDDGTVLKGDCRAGIAGFLRPFLGCNGCLTVVGGVSPA